MGQVSLVVAAQDGPTQRLGKMPTSCAVRSTYGDVTVDQELVDALPRGVV
jgi:hypothetical protein